MTNISVLTSTISPAVYTWDDAKPWIWAGIAVVMAAVIIGIGVYSYIKKKKNEAADKNVNERTVTKDDRKK